MNALLRPLAPVALVGALLLTGCSISIPTGGSAIEVGLSEEDIDQFEGTDMREDEFHGSDALNAAAAALSERLDDAAADAEGVGVKVYGEYVNISIVVAEGEEAVSAATLRAVLDEIAVFPAAGVAEWMVDGWDLDGWGVDVLGAAAELGLPDAVVDEEWDRISVTPETQALLS